LDRDSGESGNEFALADHLSQPLPLGKLFAETVPEKRKKKRNKVFVFGQPLLVPLLLLGPPVFPIILFGSTTLLARMTGNCSCMQWPLTSQLRGTVSQREQLVFPLWIKLHARVRMFRSLPG
jgi:hypothetical protein